MNYWDVINNLLKLYLIVFNKLERWINMKKFLKKKTFKNIGKVRLYTNESGTNSNCFSTCIKL